MCRSALDPCKAPTDYDGVTTAKDRTPRIQNGRPLGWIAGLGVVLVPWLVSGVISTILPHPEASFPWVLLGAFVTMVTAMIWAGAKVPGFKRGALIGSAISLSTFGALLMLVHLLAP